MDVDRPSRLLFHFGADGQRLTDGYGPPERDREPRGDAPDALMEDRPTHGLVEERGHDPAVDEAVVPGVLAAAHKGGLGAAARNVEVEMEAVGVRAAAREAPVIEVDAEL